MIWLSQRIAVLAFNIVSLMVAWRYRYEIKAFAIQAIHFINKP